MSAQAAAGRLARLTAHLQTGAESSSSSAGGLQQQPTAAAGGAAAASPGSPARSFHQRCFNFEPGRLLLDQVAIVTGAGAGIGKAVSPERLETCAGHCVPQAAGRAIATSC